MCAREAVKNEVPELWKQRVKAGQCPVCGKSPIEFDKGMRVYCSKKCRDEYSKKFTTWSAVRERILKRDNYTCQECGLNQKYFDDEADRAYELKKKKWLEENQDILENKRHKALVRLSEQFEKDFNEIMDDEAFFKSRISWSVAQIEKDWAKRIKLHVDHKVAIVNGGDMWDENNLQTLCENCHKKKTRKDLAERKITRAKKKNAKLKL